VLLGLAVDNAIEVPAFAGNQVFRIGRGDLVAFLKLADDADLKRELAVLQLLGPLGVPVPVIEAADPAGDLAGVPCVLLRQVDGGPLSSAAPEFGAAGPILRQVHEVSLGGFGSIVVSSEGVHGEDHTWADTVRRRIADLEPIAEAGLVAAALFDRAVAAVEDRRELLATPHGGRLLHGDFHPRHVYALGGRITAIIDWGDATCGDPVYDLGRLLHSAILEEGLRHAFSVVNRVLRSYGDAPWLQADPTDMLLVYAVVFTIWSMRGEFSAGTPWPAWWPAQATALSAIVDELDRP
jgi:aminoglycoside phosphotransferase (APT) family kinase protein